LYRGHVRGGWFFGHPFPFLTYDNQDSAFEAELMLYRPVASSGGFLVYRRDPPSSRSASDPPGLRSLAASVSAHTHDNEPSSAMKKVLVIDDDEMALMMTRRVLEDAGYEVKATADGPQGIRLYEEHHPDAVLLDLGLPSMSGLDVLRAIRDFDSRARIIVFTGYMSAEFENQASRYGALFYVEKSAGPELLLSRVQQALGEGPSSVF
jgi:CheY-like chemotaxis protein